MSNFTCVFCSATLQTEEYNLNLTKSLHSEILLINLIQDIIVEGVNLPHLNICTECYNILNELDYLIVRQKEIYKELKYYLLVKTLKTDVNATEETSLTQNNIERTSVTDSNSDVLLPKDELIEDIKTEECIEEYMENDRVNESDKSCSIKKRGRKKIDPSKRPLHKCHCSKIFYKKSDLEKHLLSHSNHGPHVCDICGQAYKHKNAFKIHLDMHNGINAYTCTYCNKSFTQKGALNRHIRIHTGDRPYQCHLCGKTFVHNTSFTMHKLSHTGKRTCKCAICGIALISKSHLKRHMRVHTGEKKYACSTCGKRFAERYNLGVHEKLHKSDGDNRVVRKRTYGGRLKNNFVCDCGDSFHKRSELALHLIQKHPGKHFHKTKETDGNIITRVVGDISQPSF